MQVPGESASLLLALMWASLANVSAAAFWSVAFLLLPEHDIWKQTVGNLVRESWLQGSDDQTAASQDAGNCATDAICAVVGGSNSCCLQQCIDEAIRLRAMSALPPIGRI